MIARGMCHDSQWRAVRRLLWSARARAFRLFLIPEQSIESTARFESAGGFRILAECVAVDVPVSVLPILCLSEPQLSAVYLRPGQYSDSSTQEYGGYARRLSALPLTQIRG